MKSLMLERLLCGGTLGMLLVAGALAYRTVHEVRPAQRREQEVVTSRVLTTLDGDLLDRDVKTAIGGNIFRRERFDDAQAMQTTTTPLLNQASTVPKPRLSLRGLVGGPPWNAIIEGVPGRSGGVVLRVGDTVGGFTLKRVRSGEVNIAGMDTTWTLLVERRVGGGPQ